MDFDSISSSSPSWDWKKEQVGNFASKPTKKVIRGQPVSPGLFSGKVRVIDFIDKDVQIQHNDIVVTKCIDPGQTHIFLLAGALIFEVGGILSHGAILAREFNLPTVAQVKDATHIFKNQQYITVDGSKGEIIVRGG